MLAQQAEPAFRVAGAPLVVGTDLGCGRYRGPIGEVAGVVLDVDYEGVDLSRVGQFYQFIEALAAECLCVEVDRAERLR